MRDTDAAHLRLFMAGKHLQIRNQQDHAGQKPPVRGPDHHRIPVRPRVQGDHLQQDGRTASFILVLYPGHLHGADGYMPLFQKPEDRQSRGQALNCN